MGHGYGYMPSVMDSAQLDSASVSALIPGDKPLTPDRIGIAFPWS